jgi:hypothetical protein
MRAVLARTGVMCILIAGCSGEVGETDVLGTGGVAGPNAGAGVGGSFGTGGAGGLGLGLGGTGIGGNTSNGVGGAPTGGAGAGGMTTTGAGGAAGSPGAGRPPVASTGTIVPLYTNPGDSSWNVVAAAKQAHPTVPVIAVVNPTNGPGPARDAGYAAGIGKLQLVGVTVIGYVATGYTARGIAAVEADIDRWKSFYPALQGIFFDEQSNRRGDEAFYSTVSQYAKSKGLSFTVGNPGADTGPTFVGVVDVGLIYESFGVPGASVLTGWHTGYPRENFGIIPYGATLDHAYVKQAKAYVGYIYVTNDNLPNPWDSVPSYFADLLADLEG